MAFLTTDDLEAFADINDEKAEQMIADAEALALLAAPCLAEPDPDVLLTDAQKAAVKAVLRSAILRWNDAGSGALQSEQVGPFGQTYDNRQQRRSMFWPSEIVQLQDICGGTSTGGAFALDTIDAVTYVHADICALRFGALYCSCGAILTGYVEPLYEIT